MLDDNNTNDHGRAKDQSQVTGGLDRCILHIFEICLQDNDCSLGFHRTDRVLLHDPAVEDWANSGCSEI